KRVDPHTVRPDHLRGERAAVQRRRASSLRAPSQFGKQPALADAWLTLDDEHARFLLIEDRLDRFVDGPQLGLATDERLIAAGIDGCRWWRRRDDTRRLRPADRAPGVL